MKQDIEITIASAAHMKYLPEVEHALLEASFQKGTGIAVRSNAYLTQKIMEGKAVIAYSKEGKWAGFCYIESWGHNKYVANSGLIVASEFRGIGLANEIKKRALELSAELFPGAKLFGLTTSLAVMKIKDIISPLKFDVGYILPPSFGAASSFKLAGVKERIGYIADGRRLLLTRPLPLPAPTWR